MHALKICARGWLILAALFSFSEARAQTITEKQLQEWAALRPEETARKLDRYFKTPDRNNTIRCKAMLLAGRVHMRLSDYGMAEHFAERALILARKTEKQQEPIALRQLARIYQASNRYTEGQHLLQQAMHLFQKQGNQEEAINTQLDLIEFYRAAADPEMSWKLYQNLKPEMKAGKLSASQKARLLHRAAAASA
ncbi:MAG: hypothetical protein EOO03_15200, partial [Chitinophagaceae bacterium]